MATGLVLAVLGGIVPALVWLSFWLREDYKHPEPKGTITKTFLFGIVAVALVIPLEQQVETLFPNFLLVQLLLWAVIEEAGKFAAGYLGGIRSRDDNEPLDPLVYMITAALGFVALENTLFILTPVLGHNLLEGVVTSNMRFIGASLLHVVSSGVIGACLSFGFYKARQKKISMLLGGLAAAVGIHVAFNFLVLQLGDMGIQTAFVAVWLGVLALLWIFERAKSIAPEKVGV